MCDTALLEKLAVFFARTHVHPFFTDFDKKNCRRILPDQGVRALSAAGLNLTKAEQDQVQAAYTGEDGMFVYDALYADGACGGRLSPAHAPFPRPLLTSKPPPAPPRPATPRPASQQRAPRGLL
jgi:hypothetical protein